MGDGAREQEILPQEQKHQEPPDGLVIGRGVADKSNGVVPTKEYDDLHKCAPAQFDQDIGRHKGCPVVDFGESFAGFVEVALGYEHGHNLLIVVHEEHEENKDGPELVLQALD